MPAEEQRSGGMRSGAHGGLMCPLEKGDRGIETSGSGYLRQQIRGGRKGRAERQGLGQSPNEKLERISDSEMHCATILFEPAVRPDPSPALTPGRIVDDHTHIQTYKDEIQV